MAFDENFLLLKIMDLNSSIASISGKIDGFLQMQTAQQAEITTIKSRLDDAETDISGIKQTHTTVKNQTPYGVSDLFGGSGGIYDGWLAG